MRGYLDSTFQRNQRECAGTNETDTSGTMPEVMKILIERTFLKNAKPKYKEVYLEIDSDKLEKFGSRPRKPA